MHTYEEFLKVIEELRSEHGCPWDREQTHASLKQCMLEEAYEVIEGIEEYETTGDYKNLREELGDVLLQVVLHARIAEEEGRFTMEDIVDEICEKMIRRHPHVFGDAAAENSKESLLLWEDIKKQEKKEETLIDTLNRVAKAFPANIRAEKIQKKAAKYGLEFESTEQVLGKVKEELEELCEVIRESKNSGNQPTERVEEEFGDLLFSMINLSRFLGVNAENSLTNATNKFINRCAGIENLAREKGEKLNHMSSGDIDVLWQSMKQQESAE